MSVFNQVHTATMSQNNVQLQPCSLALSKSNGLVVVIILAL